MTYDEFKSHVRRAGLTITAFADLLGRSKASITNYGAPGAVPDHLAILVVLLGDMAEAGLDFRASIRRLDLTPKKKRGRGFGADAPVS